MRRHVRAVVKVGMPLLVVPVGAHIRLRSLADLEVLVASSAAGDLEWATIWNMAVIKAEEVIAVINIRALVAGVDDLTHGHAHQRCEHQRA